MDLYDIVFKGEVMPGLSPAQVKADLAQLFRTTADQLEPLFDGQPHALKAGLSRDQAERYHSALKRAGAVIYLRRAGAQRAQPDKPQGGLCLTPQRGNILRDDERTPTTPADIDTSALQVAPLDSGPLSPPQPEPPPPPNTDHIHLAQ